LSLYLSGDTALISDMKTIVNGFHKVKLAVLNIGSGEESSFAINELIQPHAVIPSHANEAATAGGQVKPGTRTRQFIDLVKGRPVHVPFSGKTMQFDGNAKCTAGC
jgi:L-ascorbate metabolism protein UlaG (beta-lactamase superfamily)